MKGHGFVIGRSQIDDYRHIIRRLQVVAGVIYSAAVLSAIRDLKDKPAMLKVPVKPTLTGLIPNGTLVDTTTVVSDNHLDMYTQKIKMNAKVEIKFELDCQRAYLLVKGQCSPKMIAKLKCHDDYGNIEKQFHLVNLLKLIKKICYNYKTQDDPLQAIVKSTGALYYTKQKKDELVEDFILSTVNRLAVYMLIRGTVLNIGVNEHLAKILYNKAYTALTTAEKKTCDVTWVKRVTAMISFGNADRECLGKLQDEVHIDHLKETPLYQKIVTRVLQLLTSNSTVFF